MVHLEKDGALVTDANGSPLAFDSEGEAGRHANAAGWVRKKGGPRLRIVAAAPPRAPYSPPTLTPLKPTL
jgi:hypothetical protein